MCFVFFNLQVYNLNKDNQAEGSEWLFLYFYNIV